MTDIFTGKNCEWQESYSFYLHAGDSCRTYNDYVETIHQRIKRLREAKGANIQAMADACDVTNQSARQWEALPGDPIKATSPRRGAWPKLAEFLGVSEAELLTGAPVADKKRSPPTAADLRRADDKTMLAALGDIWHRISHKTKRAILVIAMESATHADTHRPPNQRRAWKKSAVSPKSNFYGSRREDARQ